MPTLTSYFPFSLLPNQQRAFDALCNFAASKENKIFILRGYAGTGKTSLMSGFIRKLAEMELPYVLLATTGRAAKILSDKTNIIATTIHSCIFGFTDLNRDLEELSKLDQTLSVDSHGQLRLLFDLTPIQSENETIYIVDEASMIADRTEHKNSFAEFGSGDLLGDLLEYDSKGKFVFVGDPCQLPPVGLNYSPALFPRYIAQKYDVDCVGFELRKIVRQKEESGILKISMGLRALFSNAIRKPESKFSFTYLPLKGFNDVVRYASDMEMLNRYIALLQEKGYEYSTLICQTNKICASFNEIIRKTIHNNPVGLLPGDLLMVTQNNYLADLVNGDLVKVLQVGGRQYRAGLAFIHVEVEELSSKKIFRLLLVENLLNSYQVNLNSNQHKSLYVDFYLRMKDRNISQKSSRFKEEMLKDPYLNALRASYGYAITCHKSQGGEWLEVFLYMNKQIQSLSKPGIYQWWYTAITRAKEKLHVVDDWFIK